MGGKIEDLITTMRNNDSGSYIERSKYMLCSFS